MFLSDVIIPLLIFSIVGYGLMGRHNIYEEFTEGAKDGLKTVAGIMPTLIGLMVAVGILRASGFLEAFAGVCAVATERLGFPSSFCRSRSSRCFPPLLRRACSLIFTSSTERIPCWGGWRRL